MKTALSKPLVWVIVLAPTALVFGYVGYRSVPGTSMSPIDALFASFQLFGMEGGAPSQGVPWTLNVARFLAPLVLALATVVAVMVVLRDNAQRFWVSAFAREHVVVVGLGTWNAHIVEALRRVGHSTVVVEADAANSRIPTTRANGTRVVIGDATQPSMVRHAQALRAKHVVIATGDDTKNLEIADNIRRHAKAGRHTRRLTVHVALNDQILWAELGRLQLGRVESGLALEFYNVFDRGAQSLVGTVEREMGDRFYNAIAFEGAGPLAERVLVHFVRRAMLSGVQRPHIYVSQQTSVDLTTPLLVREPWTGESAQVIVGEEAADAIPALVCHPASDASALALALAMTRTSRRTVYVSVAGQETDALLQHVGAARGIRLVPTSMKALSESFLRQSGPELMARARHEDYVATERAKGSTERNNSSLVPWDDLPESLKDSNRRYAESIGEVVHSLGGSLVPFQKQEAAQHLQVTDDALERIAASEHNRWMRALVTDGWIYAPGVKDAQGKTHPLLVDWSALDEVERVKDRDAIRAIPTMLARVGYAIEFDAPSEVGATAKEAQ